MRRLAFLLPLAAAACGQAPPEQDNLAALDAALIDVNTGDPALTAALHDQIMVDPALAQSSNGNAVRPPPRPDPLAVPLDSGTGGNPIGGALTLGALAAQVPGTAGCAATIGYSAMWATRLPAAFPLYPDAAVAEAAGNDRGGCALRIVSFAASAPPARTLAWYAARARANGYSVERTGDTRVAGQRGPATYVVYAQPRTGGGSDVDLIVDGG
ncbi:hypothetical protein [Sphingomonas sp.]|jgi:hypothetical protein|uniref:hypothetical protein n=1 Tax=Sphingomonas sp. TaxID=28214 RepID=UPI002EDAE3CF